MSLRRPVIALAGAALAGIALVGVGASATFTDSTTSSQKITAGSLNVVVSAPGTSCPNADWNCKTLTLPAVGPVGSTFETTATYVTVTNKGTIPAIYKSFQLTESHANNDASVALRNQTNVCLQSADPGYAPGTANHSWVEGNGPLIVAVNLNPTVAENPVVLEPGATAIYWVDFYAGKNSACGTTYSDGTNTRNAWYAAAGNQSYSMPASLTNDAMGGEVTPTVAFNFTG